MVTLSPRTVVIHGKFGITPILMSVNLIILLFNFSFCSRNKKVCKGQPCLAITTSTSTTTITTTTTTSKPILDENINKTIDQTCSNGWSVWINVNTLNSKSLTKFEYMPTFEDLKSIEYNNVKNLKGKVR